MLRVSERIKVDKYDDMQYAVYVLHFDKGKEKWYPVSYCTTLKVLRTRARELYVEHALVKPREAAKAAFDMGVGDKILDLPPISKKKKKSA